ncbi:hypothetical protein P170DRAFT_259680 [Aspergillus steynii IBT 23096]|uniref:Transcription factor domain-containing protein n=1 Tax=Aspergillus steynii IBT 23096 TaxID=1392250 RepID=A0A2I2FZM2_9EURO|nr:uncharacterized protein P170DRAFT_259680 [Aspergillus steynii IBT 23096]PLB46079.1 hypothetical protein P170DRAFT_259680 [Aspergillus steynii IBT 23096]
MQSRPLQSANTDSVEPASSSFSIFSPEGLKWLCDKAGYGTIDIEDFDSPLHPENKFIDDDPMADAFLTQPFIELPPKSVAMQLFNTYFREMNPFCPLFDENEFMSRVEYDYPIYPQSSPSWWACINATIALSCAFETGLYSKAWLYWKNATLSLNSFFIERPQLSSAQALLAMTAYLIGTFSATPSQTFVSLALRILHGLNPAEYERSPAYRRVLAITYDLDIDISLRSATPPTQPIPTVSLNTLFDDRINHKNSNSSNNNFATSYIFDLFDSYTGLTTLKSHVYRELYSATASDKSDPEIIAIVGQLDTLLEDWRNGIPLDYRPEVARPDDVIRRDPHMSIFYVHFSYYSCILAIHRKAISRATWSMNLDPRSCRLPPLRSPNPRTLISTQLCVQAARKSMELVQHLPQHHKLFGGSIAYCVMFALMILSMLIVQDPQVARGNTDIELMRAVESFFSDISMIRSDENISNFVQCCARYRSIAETAIKQSRKGMLRK